MLPDAATGGLLGAILLPVIAWAGRAGILWLKNRSGQRDKEIKRLDRKEAQIDKQTQQLIDRLDKDIDELHDAVTAKDATIDRLRAERDEKHIALAESGIEIKALARTLGQQEVLLANMDEMLRKYRATFGELPPRYSTGPLELEAGSGEGDGES